MRIRYVVLLVLLCGCESVKFPGEVQLLYRPVANTNRVSISAVEVLETQTSPATPLQDP